MKKITHLNGVAVIAQEKAVGPHPRYRDMIVQINGVTKVLLEDGSEKFVCNEDGYSADAIRSVTGHMASHNAHGPLYSADVIKAVLRAVKRHAQLGDRGKLTRAAADLNAQKVPTYRGNPWSPQAVSSVYSQYKDMYRVHVPRPVSPALAPAAESVTLSKPLPAQRRAEAAKRNDTSKDDITGDLVRRTRQLSVKLRSLSDEVEELSRDIALAVTTPKIDPVILEKAAKWDSAQALFGGNKS